MYRIPRRTPRRLSAFPRLAVLARLVVMTVLAGVPGWAGATSVAPAGGTATAQLKVTGVLRPGPCTVDLAASGKVDYGNIARKAVPMDAPLKLPVRTLQVTIGCDDPMHIKITARDEKPGTAVLGLVPGEDQFAFGLGSVAHTNIGQYRIVPLPGTFSGVDARGRTDKVDLLYGYASRSHWSRSGQPYFWADGDTRQSFAVQGTLESAAYRHVTGTFQIETYINRRRQLPGGEIALAGLATIEIFYQ